jgi:hypothetical protein
MLPPHSVWPARFKPRRPVDCQHSTAHHYKAFVTHTHDVVSRRSHCSLVVKCRWRGTVTPRRRRRPKTDAAGSWPGARAAQPVVIWADRWKVHRTVGKQYDVIFTISLRSTATADLLGVYARPQPTQSLLAECKTSPVSIGHRQPPIPRVRHTNVDRGTVADASIAALPRTRTVDAGSQPSPTRRRCIGSRAIRFGRTSARCAVCHVTSCALMSKLHSVVTGGDRADETNRSSSSSRRREPHASNVTQLRELVWVSKQLPSSWRMRLLPATDEEWRIASVVKKNKKNKKTKKIHIPTLITVTPFVKAYGISTLIGLEFPLEEVLLSSRDVQCRNRNTS